MLRGVGRGARVWDRFLLQGVSWDSVTGEICVTAVCRNRCNFDFSWTVLWERSRCVTFPSGGPVGSRSRCVGVHAPSGRRRGRNSSKSKDARRAQINLTHKIFELHKSRTEIQQMPHQPAASVARPVRNNAVPDDNFHRVRRPSVIFLPASDAQGHRARGMRTTYLALAPTNNRSFGC